MDGNGRNDRMTKMDENRAEMDENGRNDRMTKMAENGRKWTKMDEMTE